MMSYRMALYHYMQFNIIYIMRNSVLRYQGQCPSDFNMRYVASFPDLSLVPHRQPRRFL